MNKNVIIIGISGGSCSGKTWMSNWLKDILPQTTTIIPLDNYYKQLEIVKSLEFEHDNPASIDYDILLADVESLQNGKSIMLPVYDYESHKVIGEKECPPTPVIILDGLFVYADQRVREKVDIKLWVEADENIKRERRLRRDLIERGDSYQSAIDRYTNYVVPSYEKYIQHYREYADIIIRNNDKARFETIRKTLLF